MGTNCSSCAMGLAGCCGRCCCCCRLKGPPPNWVWNTRTLHTAAPFATFHMHMSAVDDLSSSSEAVFLQQAICPMLRALLRQKLLLLAPRAAIKPAARAVTGLSTQAFACTACKEERRCVCLRMTL